MRILGIETSCDETAAAVYDSALGLMSHAVYSQIDLHASYGGVVPELASRDHIRKIVPLVEAALSKAGVNQSSLDAVAYTAGPGLVGALLVGAAFASSFAFGLGIPTIGVHHMEAHLLAPMLETPAPSFPFLALLVSGGHTLLVSVAALGDYKVLGASVDDAAGEAFDKVAKILGLPYPGGPHIAALAKTGNPARFHFPRPMTNRPSLDFSFSGLKTHAHDIWQKYSQEDALLSPEICGHRTSQKLLVTNDSTLRRQSLKSDIARSFEDAVVDTLCIKCKQALTKTKLPRLVVAGGVSANLNLRTKLSQMATALKVEIFYPRLEFCTDNAAMVAYTGYRHLLLGAKSSLAIKVFPRGDIGASKTEY